MKKGYIWLNALLLTLIGWLVPSCKTPSKAAKSQDTKVETPETKPENEEPMMEETDTLPTRGREMRMLYGPPSMYR